VCGGIQEVIQVLALALYGPLAASTRHRIMQYIPGLLSHGVKLHVRYLLDDAYLRHRFYGSPLPWTELLKSAHSRLRDLRVKTAFDAAFVHCELFPLMPGWCERALLPESYIYDFDDAFYLRYRTGKLSVFRPLLGGKFDTVMSGARAVTAGSVALASYASARNSNTHLLPTTVDTDRYVPFQRRSGEPFTVGWIGSPTTAPYLAALVEPLANLGRSVPVRFVVIGGRAPRIPNVAVEEVAWTEESEVAQISRFDVGVMPLPDEEWARGKCAFKLIQYMACGVPVVASSVGANVDVVDAESGILVEHPADWLDAMAWMHTHPLERRRMGEAARSRVEARYSLRGNLPRFAQVFKSAA
jgi:glycosyltransferase involved in cell wall biosynthesis